MMRTLTIKEPYATLIAEGIKKYEFRSWSTNYRGDIYIHAGKSHYQEIKDFPYQYRYGEIVAIAQLTDVIKLNATTGKQIQRENPKVYSLHTEGYAWVLTNIRKVENSPKISGKLGFWQYEL